MGLMNFIRKELIDIIEFTDDSRDTLSWRFPDEDKEIKRGAQLIVRARAFGIYDFHVIDPKIFLKEVAGTDAHFHLDEFSDTMRSRIVSVFSEALAQSRVPLLDVARRYSELGESLLPLINPVMKV